KIAGSRRMKTMGGKSTGTWMSYPFFIHSNSSSRAWRDWLTPIGQGGYWLMPTCEASHERAVRREADIDPHRATDLDL
ncbi:MAG TPA: hypothetical protein VK749_03575, partial [Xanthobacteraceae bacterium]|nr:hypothetical protein [Xanthobacteraceae bacterium]